MTDIYRILKINDRKWVIQKLVRYHSLRDRINWLFGKEPFAGWLAVGRPQVSYDKAHELMERMADAHQ